MAHTPLASMVQRAFAAAHMEMEKQKRNEKGIQPDRNISKSPVYPNMEEGQYSNLKREMKNAPRIIIVGAGLAGLTCAYRLKQAGILSTIYEATDRVGGRCWTRRGAFKENQIVERGGELINTGHMEIRNLAEEFNLKLDNLIEAETKGTEPRYYLKGSSYTLEEATKDFLGVYPQLQKDLEEVGETTLYNSFTERGFELDHMSIVDYINEIVPGGIHSKFGQLLVLAYTIEYGADADQQSALNLLYLLGFSPKGSLNIFGDSDEQFHIRGGNDLLPELLAKELDGQIKFNAELMKIEQNSLGEIRLVFRNSESRWEVFAEKVVLTIPFRILRLIDYEDAGFSSLKVTAIEEIGVGVNTKLHAQFSNRFWRKLGTNGGTFSDTGYQNTWEVSRAQKGKSGILVNYTGAGAAANINALTEEQLEEITESFFEQLKPVLPGSEKYWKGLSTVDHWLSNQWSRGSYSYFKVGQYTKFAGIAGEREGNIFFAGEHTSVAFQGYLNGAVETGERASQEVLEDLKVK